MRMRLLGTMMLIAVALAPSRTPAQTPANDDGQRFVSIALHDVADARGDLNDDGTTSDRLVALFEWLAGNDWTAITLDDIDRARRGVKPLPPRAILLTVDDGYQSLYTRVYPLALAYRMPVVAALVGDWLDTPADRPVAYGQERVARSRFITWAQAREMQASGLVEFASHSHALHTVVHANPQGNQLAAAQTLRYAPGQGYETHAQFRERIRDDLTRSRTRMREELGREPRALVWPYGRYNASAAEVARSLGFAFLLTLDPQPGSALHPDRIARFLPTDDPKLGVLVSNLRFDDPWPNTHRIVAIDTATLVADGAAATDERLGRAIDRLVAIGATQVVLDAAVVSGDGRIESVWFPSTRLPVRQDVLSRFAAQMRVRAGVEVIVRLPHTAVRSTLPDEASALALYEELGAQVPMSALWVEDAAALASTAASADDSPWDVAPRRDAVDTSTWPAPDAFALRAFHAVERWRPDLQLYWLAPPTHPLETPSALADVTLVPADAGAPKADAEPPLPTAAARRSGRWWSLRDAADGDALVRAVREYQTRGGTVIGWHPDDPLRDAPPAREIAPAVSARTYPAQDWTRP